MPEQDLPPELEELLRRADNAFGTLRTSLMRAYELPIPEYEGPTPDELSEAAKDATASPALRAVDALVRKGKFTWDDVLRGRADGVAEVGALQEFGKRQLIRLIEDGPQDEPVEEKPAKPHRPDDDDAGGPMMRDAW